MSDTSTNQAASPEVTVLASFSDAEILRSVEQTLRDVVLPALPEGEEWARTASVQLIGLVRYALRREPDRSALYLQELLATLESLQANALVSELWGGERSQRQVMEVCGAILARSAGEESAASEEVRAVLRPVVLDHLDQELAETTPLVAAFRGNLEDE